MGSITIPAAAVFGGDAVAAATGATGFAVDWGATAAAWGAGLGAVGSAASAWESHEAGVAASNEDKQKARVAALNATQQQINQRQNMLRALASQNANAGVGGIGTGGGFGANVQRQITQNQSDLLVDSANGSAQVSLLDQAAGNALATGNINASTGLLKGASQLLTGGS